MPPRANFQTANLVTNQPYVALAPYRTIFDIGNQGISRLNKPYDYLFSLQLSAFLFACIDLRASTVAKYAIRAIAPDGTEVFGPQNVASSRKHRLYRLLQQPNPVQTYFDFIYTIQMYLDLLGNCLVLLDGIKDASTGLPTSLWPLDPSRCYPVFDTETNVHVGYGFKDSQNEDQFVPKDRVLHFKRPSPLNIYWGQGIVQVLAKEINIHAAMTEYVSQYFNQGAQASGFLVSKNPLSDEAFDRLKLEAMAALSGPANAHRLPLFDNGIEYHELAANLKELGIEELDKNLMKKILTAFQVPGTKFGLLEFASYKAEDMERSFTEAMESIAQLLEGTLNRLANLYDKKGKPVPADEMDAVRSGTYYDGDPKGITIEFVIPAKDPLMTLVQTANLLAANPVLAPEEARNGVLQLLGGLLTAPTGFDTKLPANSPAAMAFASNAAATKDPVATANAEKQTQAELQQVQKTKQGQQAAAAAPAPASKPAPAAAPASTKTKATAPAKPKKPTKSSNS